MSFLAYITVIPATPSRRLVFRLRTRHIESPSGLRGIVYLYLLVLNRPHVGLQLGDDLDVVLCVAAAFCEPLDRLGHDVVVRFGFGLVE